MAKIPRITITMETTVDNTGLSIKVLSIFIDYLKIGVIDLAILSNGMG